MENLSHTQADVDQSQVGGVSKGANPITNVVTDEGRAADLKFSSAMLLRRGCFRDAKGSLNGPMERIDEWRNLSYSTERGDPRDVGITSKGLVIGIDCGFVGRGRGRVIQPGGLAAWTNEFGRDKVSERQVRD